MRTFSQICSFGLIAAALIVGVLSFSGAYILYGMLVAITIGFLAPFLMVALALIILMLCSVDERIQEANRLAKVAIDRADR